MRKRAAFTVLELMITIIISSVVLATLLGLNKLFLTNLIRVDQVNQSTMEETGFLLDINALTINAKQIDVLRPQLVELTSYEENKTKVELYSTGAAIGGKIYAIEMANASFFATTDGFTLQKEDGNSWLFTK